MFLLIFYLLLFLEKLQMLEIIPADEHVDELTASIYCE